MRAMESDDGRKGGRYAEGQSDTRGEEENGRGDSPLGGALSGSIRGAGGGKWARRIH